MGRRPAALLQRPDVPEDTPDDAGSAAMLTPKQAARALLISMSKMRDMYTNGPLVEDVDFKRYGNRIRIFRKRFCEENGIPLDHDFGPR